ncbi:hypothetical protein [Colwellia sp. MB02u-9]|uniref:hypothetical protein n=1 Tax=Colwellia sp. MB02u-9 TaxID=2759823 RepID=UPI0021750518|nr:hypothetical protein [Colwellia sp. MB02u-9]
MTIITNSTDANNTKIHLVLIHEIISNFANNAAISASNVFSSNNSAKLLFSKQNCSDMNVIFDYI